LTTDQTQANEDQLDIARRIYREMCVQYPNRLIILVDPRGCMLARNDRLCEPLAEASKLSN
jgi:hypothetical protein